MKIVNFGSSYQIYPNNINTYDQLPAATYNLCFSQQTGFSLAQTETVTVSEKSYGSFTRRIDKVLSTYEDIQRNLGVILSGDKGIGKSFFAKRLSKAAIDTGLPVIIVDRYIPGIANFLNSIDQRCLILFDEFDKTFVNDSGESNSMNDPQTEMLTLFDGINIGEKLFVITCNNIWTLNSYLLNRPGRFHYHFRFTYPTAEEVREYLNDHTTNCEEEIENVACFSARVHLTYDCLRAIAYELNTGETFQSALEYLNIIATDTQEYNVKFTFSDNTAWSNVLCVRNNQSYDIYDDEIPDNICHWRISDKGISVSFSPADITFSPAGKLFIPLEKIKVKNDEDCSLKIVSCDILTKAADTYTYRV